MNLEQLREQFRADADDLLEPYLFADEVVDGWFTESVSEAAIRARLIFEGTDPAVTQIAVVAGTANYPLHKLAYELTHLRFVRTGGDSYGNRVWLKNRQELDRIEPRWRGLEEADPRFAVQDDTRLTLVGKPTEAGTLYLECYRLPLDPLVNDSDEPEINEAHHLKLVHWPLYRAFSRPDSETYDADRAAMEMARFEAVFGKRPDADMRRSTQVDEVQTNKPFWV